MYNAVGVIWDCLWLSTDSWKCGFCFRDFWLRQEPKESRRRALVCDFPQIMSSSNILKSPGASRASKQVSKQASKHLSRQASILKGVLPLFVPKKTQILCSDPIYDPSVLVQYKRKENHKCLLAKVFILEPFCRGVFAPSLGPKGPLSFTVGVN